MLRTFAEHDVRLVDSLNGLWDFVIAPERKGRTRLPKTYNRRIHIPSAWESLPGLENYRGKAWLRTTVPMIEGQALRLAFGGVSHTATVFIDGKQVGHHYDAFTPWAVVVPARKTGVAELVVEVDNSFGEHSALHLENDYYTYGGITRPVELQHVPEVFIEQVHATPARAGKRWDLAVQVRLRNWSKQAHVRRVCVSLGEAVIDLGRVTIKPGDVRLVKGMLAGLDVDPWTAETPDLYYVEALLFADDELVDDMVTRVGFRDVSVKGRKLLLNNRAIRLRGYNRHEDHPQYGCAIPVEAMVTDLEIMRDLGCNFVRTCHYPNDQRFLDLCDEMGVYVWEESHARNVDFKHPRFREQIADSTTEMVDGHRNHPSIIIWGCLNECDSTSPGGRREHARVLKLLKKLDPSRPVTFASNKGQNDSCLDLVDIVSWNRYDGWYGGEPDCVEPHLADVLKWLHSPKSGASGKPVIMSEFGAGAIYGNRQTCESKWSEEYQAAELDECLRVYLNHPDIVGASIWQFCDVRITGAFWGGRPRTMNNKGTVDEYRRPKLAYGTVKRRMLEAKQAFGR